MLVNDMPIALVIEAYAELAITTISVLLTLAGLLHCAFQKPASFPPISPLTKGAWLAILAGCMVLAALGFGGGGGGFGGIFGIIGLVAGLVYLLDIRPAIRDLGSNPW